MTIAIATPMLKINTVKIPIIIRGIAILIKPKNIKRARKTVKIREIYTILSV